MGDELRSILTDTVGLMVAAVVALFLTFVRRPVARAEVAAARLVPWLLGTIALQPTCVFCMVGAGAAMTAFWQLGSTPIVAPVFLAAAGFFIYGPQALIGIIAANPLRAAVGRTHHSRHDGHRLLRRTRGRDGGARGHRLCAAHRERVFSRRGAPAFRHPQFMGRTPAVDRHSRRLPVRHRPRPSDQKSGRAGGTSRAGNSPRIA